MHLQHVDKFLNGHIPALTRLPKPILTVVCTLAILALVACGEAPEEPDEIVMPDREISFELTMGTGKAAFERLDDGGVLVLERGSQGLQHIYVSLRAPIAEGFHLIDLSLTYNGEVFSSPTRVNAPFLSVSGEELTELVGQYVVVPEPTGVLDVTATLRASVASSDGGYGEVLREVRVRW